MSFYLLEEPGSSNEILYNLYEVISINQSIHPIIQSDINKVKTFAWKILISHES